MPAGPAPAMAVSPFERYQAADIRRLVDDHPLAWVGTVDGEEASLLPLVGHFNAGGELVELIGHFALANPLAPAFARDPRAIIQFTGPQAYLSPSQAGRRDWAPTWVFAQLRVWVEISVEPDLTGPALDLLIGHVEQGRAAPWRATELGQRYDVLRRQIVGFRARVVRQRARFKLGQDERLDTLHTLLGNIADPVLADWMRHFNRERLAPKAGSDEC